MVLPAVSLRAHRRQAHSEVRGLSLFCFLTWRCFFWDANCPCRARGGGDGFLPHCRTYHLLITHPGFASARQPQISLQSPASAPFMCPSLPACHLVGLCVLLSLFRVQSLSFCPSLCLSPCLCVRTCKGWVGGMQMHVRQRSNDHASCCCWCCCPVPSLSSLP